MAYQRNKGPVECPVCGITYGAFRSGLTFESAQQMMKTHSQGEYRNIRRHGVLGFMREFKLLAWEYHVGLCVSAGDFAKSSNSE